MGGPRPRRLLTLACSVLLASCGDSGSAPPLLPEVIEHGGPVMAHVQLVPIFFADDTDAKALASFSQWIVTSQWLQAVGADYGVGTGSVPMAVDQVEPAPATIDDTAIVDLLYRGLADGSMPKPADLASVLYMVYFPGHDHGDRGRREELRSTSAATTTRRGGAAWSCSTP